MKFKNQSDLMKEAFQHQDNLIGYAYGVLLDWDLAQDAVQDGFIAACHKWDSFDSTKELYPWLKRIVRNKAIDIIRKRKNETVSDNDTLSTMAEAALNRFSDLISKDKLETQSKALRSCLSELSDQSLSLINDFYRERKQCDEIAKESGRTVNSVYISLTRVRQQLKKCALKKIEAQS